MKVMLPGTMVHYVGHRAPLSYPASTVREALRLLVTDHPPLELVLLAPGGGVQRFHTLVLNGEKLLDADLDRPVGDGDELEVFTAVAGG